MEPSSTKKKFKTSFHKFKEYIKTWFEPKLVAIILEMFM